MASSSSDWLSKALGRVADFVERRAWWVLGLAIFATVISFSYAFMYLGINTNTTEMLAADVPFQEAREHYKKTFPQNADSILLVVEANTPEMAHVAVNTLDVRFRKEPEHIKSVYTPFGGSFFEHNALLYLDLQELQQLAESVAESKPFIDELMRERNLHGLFTMLSESYHKTHWVNESLLDSLFRRMAEGIQSSLAGLDYVLAWHSVILKQDIKDSRTRRFILVQPQLDYQKFLPAETALQAIRRIIQESAVLTIPGIRVRVTGEVALAHEELQVVSQRAGLSAILSLIMVCVTLTIAFHSWRLMVVTLLTLLVGLSLSAGFATVAVGQLNILSLAFAVLFIGLAVDYAIHLCLRYQELLGLGDEPFPAIRTSLQEVGPSLMLCAVTTGLGFYTFVPTNYTGMSELGLISGTSMFIGLVVSLTVLPAILLVFPSSKKDYRSPSSGQPLKSIYQFPIRHGKAIRWGTVVIFLGSVLLLPQASFDWNPHNLRDPHVESVQTMNDLLEDKTGATWSLTLLPSEDQVSDYVSRLGALESVDKVLTIQDFIPTQQFEKLIVLAELAGGIFPQRSDSDFPPSSPEQDSSLTAIQSFLTILEGHIQRAELNPDGNSAAQLRDAIRILVARFDNVDQELKRDLLERLDKSLLGSLPTDPMNGHASAMPMGSITQHDLPQELLERWVGKEGAYRLEVYPKKDLRSIKALEQFVNEVRSIAPEVTGLPVVYLDGGNEVAGAFKQALVSALLVIIVILAIVLRNIWDILLVILPLSLAAICLVGYTVILGLPFNYANVIALPLIFGLGADSGIHIVERMRRRPAECEAFLRSGTIRGVFFSSVTTMLSFSNLAYTSHVGIASMGQLLSLGILLTLIGCLVVLPAFLYRVNERVADTAA
ncbi:MAG: MMPL family transporter [Nitrospirales bacterium]|nr:MMPL family transporter [Nitrospirales bacterium]